MNTKIVIIKTNGKSCEDCPFFNEYNSCYICDHFNIDDEHFVNECTDINLDNPLNATIPQMISEDYKDNFIAEFKQLYIRFAKLREMCQKWDNDELNSEPTCSRAIYDAQLAYMHNYLAILWVRSKIEKIELEINPEDVDMFNSIDINEPKFIG